MECLRHRSQQGCLTGLDFLAHVKPLGRSRNSCKGQHCNELEVMHEKKVGNKNQWHFGDRKQMNHLQFKIVINVVLLFLIRFQLKVETPLIFLTFQKTLSDQDFMTEVLSSLPSHCFQMWCRYAWVMFSIAFWWLIYNGLPCEKLTFWSNLYCCPQDSG